LNKRRKPEHRTPSQDFLSSATNANFILNQHLLTKLQNIGHKTKSNKINLYKQT